MTSLSPALMEGRQSPRGEGTYTDDALTVISLVASLASAYRFVNWTGDVSTIAAINNATTMTMSGNYSITANFARINPMVAAGWYHTVGVKSDGTVVAVGRNRYGKCSAGGWDLT